MENFLIDENLSPRIAIKLRSFGYSAKTIRDVNLTGADDIQIVEWAINNDYIIITGDLDFGELWYWHYHGKLGIVLLRMKSYNFENQCKIIEFLHNNHILTSEKIKNSLVISTNKKYRIRNM